MTRVLMLSVVVCLAGCYASAASGQVSGDYRIGPRDVLEIRVFEVPELNVDRKVEDNGEVALPLLGDFRVGGLTTAEARGRLEAVLTAKYMNRANVSIVVKEFSNRPVVILGAVARPGNLPISGGLNLLQVISAAGGLASGAGKNLFVLRKAENGLSDLLQVEIARLLQPGSSSWNIPIWPSDVINVPQPTSVRVSTLGQLKSPGLLEFGSDDRLSLLAVIARAGGLTSRAALSGIAVKRRGPDGKDRTFTYDYRRIVSGKDEDPTLEPGDIIIVKESFF